jgi:hypothetical protein
MSGWYYSVGEKQMGPVDDGALLKLAAVGQLSLDTMVCHQEKTKNQWVPAERIAALKNRIQNQQIPTGKDVVTAEPVPPADPVPTTTGTNKTLLTVLAIVLGGPLICCSGCLTLGLIGNAVGVNPEPNKQHPEENNTSKDPQDEVKNKETQITYSKKDFVSAKSLFDYYESNEVKADKEVTGKQIAVSGIIESVQNDIFGNPTIVLETGEYQMVGVQCMFKSTWADKISDLSKGDSIYAVGKCTGKTLVTIVLTDCQLVHPEN